MKTTKTICLLAIIAFICCACQKETIADASLEGNWKQYMSRSQGYDHGVLVHDQLEKDQDICWRFHKKNMGRIGKGESANSISWVYDPNDFTLSISYFEYYMIRPIEYAVVWQSPNSVVLTKSSIADDSSSTWSGSYDIYLRR